MTDPDVIYGDPSDVFETARQLQGAERQAYLDRACQGNPDLRANIESMVKAYDEQGEFLANPTVDVKPTELAPLGSMIGPYKLLQQIGEGGMGVVYMAEQFEPVQHRVALKVVKPGMDSRQVLARFEAERQALAMMDHPNIAKVLDAGTTEVGRPYFVMELVKGIPLTQYCDDNHLETKERLELFAQVCDAVQHAHQKGVIHRDIKPSNVLVAEYDHRAVPKIIDFGVAKALNQRLTEITMFTQFGQIIGTPEYMSPEQARFNQLDIDTRSDIYSLGVLLYELLSGSTPFDRERLRSAAFDELIRIIREEEPPKPSTRLRTSETLPAIAAARRVTPPRLSSLISGELDWITMKALDKDRARRYDSAREFADDVRRYLQNEPIQASSPSKLYQFRKYCVRHRTAFSVAATIFFILIASSATATLGWFRAIKEIAENQKLIQQKVALIRDKDDLLVEVQAAVDRSNRESRRAEENRVSAEKEAAISKAVVGFLTKDLFASITPAEEAGRGFDVTMQQVLNVAAKRLESDTEAGGRFSEAPLVEAAIRHSLGKSFWAIGNVEKARANLERGLVLYEREGRDRQLDLYTVMVDLAKTEKLDWKDKRALELLENAHSGLAAQLGELSKEALAVRLDYCIVLRTVKGDTVAEKDLRRLAAQMTDTLGLEHPKTMLCRFYLGLSMRQQGRQKEGDEIISAAVSELLASPAQKDPEVYDALSWIAYTISDADKQEECYRQAISSMSEVLAPEHPSLLNRANSLGGVLFRQKRYDDTCEWYEKWLPVAQRALGEEHAITGMMHHNYGAAEYYRNNIDNAITQTKLAWSSYVASNSILKINNIQNNLIGMYEGMEQFDEANAFIDECVAEWLKSTSSSDPDVFERIAGGVAWLAEEGRFRECERLAKQLILEHESPFDEKELAYSWVLCQLGRVLTRQGRAMEAEPYLRRALRILREHADESDWLRFYADTFLGECLAAQGNVDESLDHLTEGLAGQVRNRAPWDEMRKSELQLIRSCRMSSRMGDELKSRSHDLIKSQQTEYFRFACIAVDVLFELDRHQDVAELGTALSAWYEGQEVDDPLYFAWALGRLGESLVTLGTLTDVEQVIDRFAEVQSACSNQSQSQWYRPLILKAQYLTASGKVDAGLELHMRTFEASVVHQGGWMEMLEASRGIVEHCLECPDSIPNMVKELSEIVDTLDDVATAKDFEARGLQGMIYLELDRFGLAEESCKIQIGKQRDQGKDVSIFMAWTLGQLAAAQLGQGKLEEGLETIERMERYLHQASTEFQPVWYWSLRLRGTYLFLKGEYKEAEAKLLAAHEGEKRFGDGSRTQRFDHASTVIRLVELYRKWDQVSPGDGYGSRVKEYESLVSTYDVPLTLAHSKN